MRGGGGVEDLGQRQALRVNPRKLVLGSSPFSTQQDVPREGAQSREPREGECSPAGRLREPAVGAAGCRRAPSDGPPRFLSSGGRGPGPGRRGTGHQPAAGCGALRRPQDAPAAGSSPPLPPLPPSHCPGAGGRRRGGAGHVSSGHPPRPRDPPGRGWGGGRGGLGRGLRAGLTGGGRGRGAGRRRELAAAPGCGAGRSARARRTAPARAAAASGAAGPRRVCARPAAEGRPVAPGRASQLAAEGEGRPAGRGRGALCGCRVRRVGGRPSPSQLLAHVERE